MYFFLVFLVIFPSVGAIALVTPTIGLQQRTIHSEWGYFCLYLGQIYICVTFIFIFFHIKIYIFVIFIFCNIYIYISGQRMRKSCSTLGIFLFVFVLNSYFCHNHVYCLYLCHIYICVTFIFV